MGSPSLEDCEVIFGVSRYSHVEIREGVIGIPTGKICFGRGYEGGDGGVGGYLGGGERGDQRGE